MDKQTGYRLLKTFKVIREKHVIGFRLGTTAASLSQMLASVPFEAIVDDIDFADESSDVTMIVFQSETAST